MGGRFPWIFSVHHSLIFEQEYGLFFSLLCSVSFAEPASIDSWMSSVPLLISGDSYCSGVLIERDIVATAYHCVATTKKVHIEWEDGSRESAEVLRVDVKRDLALISLDKPKNDRSPLELYTSDIVRGEPVYALGHPFAPAAAGKYSDLLRWSVSRGVVSQVGENWLQTDTALNPGNSGGALLDDQGRILGIVSHKFRAEGLSFVSLAAGLTTLKQSSAGMGWWGGAWLVHPAISMSLQPQSQMSLDVRSSFLFRDVVELGVRGRIYGDVMEAVELQREMYHYPISARALGRIRIGSGQESIVISGGIGGLYEQKTTYEEGLYSQNSGYAWSWMTQIRAGGIILSVEGIPSSSVVLFGVGFEPLGFRGVF